MIVPNENLYEYIIGNSKILKKMSSKSDIHTMFILSKTYDSLTFYVDNNNSYNINIIRGIKIENYLISNTYNGCREIQIKIDKKPYFELFEVQFCYINIDGLLCQIINYIKIKYDDDNYIIGKKEENECKYLNKIITIDDNIVISAIGINYYGLHCFQIIRLINDKVIDIFYEHNKLTLYESKPEQYNLDNDYEKQIIQKLFRSETNYDKISINTLIMSFYFIALEEIDAFSLYIHILYRISSWTPNYDVINIVLPNIILLIDRVIVNRDFKVINAISRIDRYLNYIIDNYDNHYEYHSYDKGILIKLHQIWKCITKIILRCKKIHHSQLNLNCYHIALLSNKRMNGSYACITALCQISLIILLGLSVKNGYSEEIFPLLESQIVIPIIFIFTSIVSYKQLSNTINFRNIFNDSKYTFYALLDFFVNNICLILIVFFNFLLLAYQDSVINVVLNSIASLFIIELDDYIVFLTDDSLNDLLINRMTHDLNKEFKLIPSVYWSKNTWLYNDKYYMNTNYVHIINNEIHKIIDLSKFFE